LVVLILIISTRNYKSQKSINKTIGLNKSNAICVKERFSMHTQTIYELSQEAERLLMLSLEHLRQLQKLPMTSLDDVALKQGEHSSQVVQPLHFSARGMDVQQATLNNELRKITRLEMVLAIVGTMKAGKSTTINAIVGTEVLPNRNRPMTALPTLIRHTPGQKEPVLHFSHVAPIDALMKVLQQRVREVIASVLRRPGN
jgi:replication fork clamp-binding protein CrfC